jgi:hypothetical protein
MPAYAGMTMEARSGQKALAPTVMTGLPGAVGKALMWR